MTIVRECQRLCLNRLCITFLKGHLVGLHAIGLNIDIKGTTCHAGTAHGKFRTIGLNSLHYIGSKGKMSLLSLLTTELVNTNNIFVTNLSKLQSAYKHIFIVGANE